jgi:hypothetical protein
LVTRESGPSGSKYNFSSFISKASELTAANMLLFKRRAP